MLAFADPMTSCTELIDKTDILYTLDKMSEKAGHKLQISFEVTDFCLLKMNCKYNQSV